jgi:hypothetical protein
LLKKLEREGGREGKREGGGTEGREDGGKVPEGEREHLGNVLVAVVAVADGQGERENLRDREWESGRRR